MREDLGLDIRVSPAEAASMRYSRRTRNLRPEDELQQHAEEELATERAAQLRCDLIWGQWPLVTKASWLCPGASTLPYLHFCTCFCAKIFLLRIAGVLGSRVNILKSVDPGASCLLLLHCSSLPLHFISKALGTMAIPWHCRQSAHGQFPSIELLFRSL